MAYTIADFTSKLPDIVRDDAGRLGALDRYVIQAITQRYSQDAPLELVSDVQGNGTNLLDLPTSDQGTFEYDFSVVKSIEFPISQMPPQYLLDSDIQIYRTPQGPKLLLSAVMPGENETLRITWTARHAEDGSTIPAKDFYALVDFAASLALESLAAIYIQTGDSSIQADVVNYRTKSQEYLALAKAVRKRYYTHMGVQEDGTGSEAAPALAIGNQYLEQNSGVDRLVHGKYSR